MSRRATGTHPSRLARGGRKGGVAEAFAAEIAGEIAALVGGPVEQWCMEAIEQSVQRQAPRVAMRAVERRLNADAGAYAGLHLGCRCGQMARDLAGGRRRPRAPWAHYGGSAPTTLATPVRPVFVRAKKALGLEQGSLPPHVLRMVGLVAAMVNFAEGHELLRELANVEAASKAGEREAERPGREIAADEKALAEPPPVAATLYLGSIDGAGVTMRAEEVAGRARTSSAPSGVRKPPRKTARRFAMPVR